MKHILCIALAAATYCCPATAQQIPDTAKVSSGKILSEQEKALAQYYLSIKAYTLKYASTPASCGDIADAAVSACTDVLNNYTRTITGVRWQDIESIGDQVQAKARRWAVQLALEAKYPDPVVIQAPQVNRPTPPAKPTRKK